MEEKFVKANELLEDESFLEELKKQDNDEAVAALFQKHGADINVEDVARMVEESGRYAEALEDGELDAEALDDVAGGIIITATTVACFALGAGAISFYSSYGYHRYFKKSKKKKK